MLPTGMAKTIMKSSYMFRENVVSAYWFIMVVTEHAIFKSDLFSLLPSFFSQTNIFSVYWLKLHVSSRFL